MLKINEISPLEVKELIATGALFIDVREKIEIEELAFNVSNLQHIPFRVFDEQYQEIPKDRQLILACHSGIRSLRVAEFLVIQGWNAENIYNLEGGIIAWTASKLSTKVGKRSFTMVEQASSCGCGSDSSSSCC